MAAALDASVPSPAPSPRLVRTAWWIALIVTLLAFAPVFFAPRDFDADEVLVGSAADDASPWMATRFDAYRFSSGAPDDVARYVARGALPWFTAPRWRYALWRPMTSASMFVEHRWFGSVRTGSQLVSCLWYALLLLGASQLYRSTLPVRVGVVASVAFALHPCHVEMVAWLTARHVLLGTVPPLFGLIAYVRARESGTGPRRWIAPLAVALGLLGSESALQMTAFFAAYEMAGARDAWSARLRSLAPVALVVLGYLLLYRAMHRGTSHQALYHDPFSDTWAALHAAPSTLVILALETFAPSLEALFLPAPSATLLIAIPVLLLAPFALRALEPGPRRAMRWLLLGVVLAFVPGIAGLPAPRMVTAATVGGCALIATELVFAWDVVRGAVARARWKRVACGLLGAAVAALHLAYAPWRIHALTRSWAIERGTVRRFSNSPALADLSAVDVVVLGGVYGETPADWLWSQLGGTLRARTIGQGFHGWFALSPSSRHVAIVRTAPDAFEFRVESEFNTVFIFADPFREPMAEGHVVVQGPLTLRAERIESGVPTRFDVRSSRSLDDGSVRLVWLDGTHVRRVTPPAPGQTIELERRWTREPSHGLARVLENLLRALGRT